MDFAQRAGRLDALRLCDALLLLLREPGQLLADVGELRTRVRQQVLSLRPICSDWFATSPTSCM